MRRVSLTVTLSVLLCATGCSIPAPVGNGRADTDDELDAAFYKLQERSSMYMLLRQGKRDDLEKLLESLVFGDVVAVGEAKFSEATDKPLVCAHLLKLREYIKPDSDLATELTAAIEKCG